MVKPVIVVDVQGMPEVIFAVRKEMANLLRRESNTETHPLLSKRLRQLADEFEAGGK